MYLDILFLKALSKFVANSIPYLMLLFVRENKTWNLMWSICNEDNSHKMSSIILYEKKNQSVKPYFIWKIEKKKSKCCLLWLLLLLLGLPAFHAKCPKLWMGPFYYLLKCLKIARWIINSVDFGQMCSVGSYQSLHCLIRPICPST